MAITKYAHLLIKVNLHTSDPVTDTLGTQAFVLCREVVLFLRLLCIYKGTLRLSFVYLIHWGMDAPVKSTYGVFQT